MKKTICLLMVVTSITANLFAQHTDDKFFELSDNMLFTRSFYIDLGNGNKMNIDLSDISDLERIGNIDSLLKVFSNDISFLKDSISSPLTTKRVDYITDALNRKKIRFQQYQPKSSSFVIDKGETSILRTGQDTINIIGVVNNPPKPTTKLSAHAPRYFHLVFYLNNIQELAEYMNGILQQKFATLQANVKSKWSVVLGTGSWYMKKDSTITADAPAGYKPGTSNDQVVGWYTANLQNYKNYFVPSFNIGLKIMIVNSARTFKWEPGLTWEPNFMFAKDSSGTLKTYRNDFLTLMYEQGGMKDHNAFKGFSYSTAFSLGYLVSRKGDFFDKNTFRLGAGRIQLYKTSLEPILYFNNFFKGVTPGIRITQSIF
jgi:hypothetical protein